MGFLKKINEFRRWAFKILTKNIGSTHAVTDFETIDKDTIKKILICRPNHRLGNQLLIIPLIQEVTDIFPNAKIDLFVKGNSATILFENYPNINRIIQLPKKHFSHFFQYLSAWFSVKSNRYDLVINAASNSSSGNLATKAANSKYKYFGDDAAEDTIAIQHNDYSHMAKHPIYGLRNYLSKSGITNQNPIPSLDIRLSSSEIEAGKKALNEIVNANDKVISLFTYATGEKKYPGEWWEELYAKLKEAFPTYAFIEILPVENVSQLDFKIPSFYSKDIREIASLIANTNLFIGADSGIMHLASASLTPTIGLFRVTNKEWYQPYNNSSLGINTNKTSKDEILKEVAAILKKKLHFVSNEF